MKDASVAVIMSTYNRRATIADAIRSIVMQSFGAWRLLIVNDGGEDVAEIVNSFGDARIEYFNRPHCGKAAQMNFALGLVKCRYVAYMDDDDVVHPDHLQVLVAALETSGREFAYSDTDWVLIGADGHEKERKIENSRDLVFEDIRLFNYINHKQVLHTLRLAESVGPYDERLKIFIDFDYIKRLAKVCEPLHVRKVTGIHYIREADGDGTVQSISGLWSRDPESAGKSLIAFFEKDPEGLVKLYWAQNAFRVETDELRRRVDDLTREMDCIRSSKSWRLTRPLRVLMGWLRGGSKDTDK